MFIYMLDCVRSGSSRCVWLRIVYIHARRMCLVLGVCALLSSFLLACIAWRMSSFRVTCVWHCLLVYVLLNSAAVIVYFRSVDENHVFSLGIMSRTVYDARAIVAGARGMIMDAFRSEGVC